MDHDHGTCLRVELRSASTSHHLEHVGDWEVHIPLQLAIVVLRAFDDDEVRGEVDSPGQRRGGDQDQDLRLDEKLLNNFAIPLGQARVMYADAELEAVLQAGVRDPALRVLQLVRCQHGELLGVLLGVRGHVRDDVERGEPCLPTRGDKDQSWLRAVWLHSMVLDRMEAWLVHRGHPWHVVFLRIALYVRSHWHWPYRGLEVE
mmetsp:Transcript_34089/g.108391  ORF Transcript_34089/g.108391 Transcript_34089/m.108391 type:complete len:203 (-) Transcript_34089:1805-2413(-)